MVASASVQGRKSRPPMSEQTDQLRQALEQVEREVDGFLDYEQLVMDAARFALRVWEGDEQLVERGRRVICRHDLSEGHNFECRDLMRAVLAAITEGSGE